nr:hypothetical protein [Morchella crassipes]
MISRINRRNTSFPWRSQGMQKPPPPHRLRRCVPPLQSKGALGCIPQLASPMGGRWRWGVGDGGKNLSLVVWGTNLTSSVGVGKFSKQIRDMIKLPPYQYSVTVGLLLSDGWLILSSSKSKNVRLGFQQSYSHKEYIYFVFSILSPYCSSLPAHRKRASPPAKRGGDARGGRTHGPPNIPPHQRWGGRRGAKRGPPSLEGGNENYSRPCGYEILTRSLPCFTELHSLFYPAGAKIIPEDIYNMLTPVALAHRPPSSFQTNTRVVVVKRGGLIMGDGVARAHGLIICTESYSIENIVRLINVLIIKYRLECTLRYHKPTQPRINIRQRSMPLLRTIVRPHMHSSMAPPFSFWFFFKKLKMKRLYKVAPPRAAGGGAARTACRKAAALGN